MNKLLVSIAIALGPFFVYVDTRPNWDDAGILAFAILGVVAFLAPWRRHVLGFGLCPWARGYPSITLGSVTALLSFSCLSCLLEEPMPEWSYAECSCAPFEMPGQTHSILRRILEKESVVGEESGNGPFARVL